MTTPAAFPELNSTISELLYPDDERPLFPGSEVLCAIFVLTALISLVGNVLVISVFTRYKSLKTGTCTLISSQSVADSLCACAGIAFAFFRFTNFGLKIITSARWTCILLLFFTNASFTASLCNIIALSLERLSIVLVLVSATQRAKRLHLAIGSIATIWPLTLITVCVQLIGLREWTPGTPCNIAIFKPQWLKYSILLPYACLLILIPLISLSIRIALQKWKSNTENTESNDTIGCPQRASQALQQIERKMVKVHIISVCVLYISFIPTFLFILLKRAKAKLFEASPMLQAADELAHVLLLIRGVVNPMIFAKENYYYRRGFQLMFNCKSPS